MQKTIKALIVLAILAFVGIAVAGEVYNRTQVTLGTSGSKTWTNDNIYASIQLVRFEVTGSTYATDTVTVSRVTAGDTTAVTAQIGGAMVLSGGAATSNIVAGVATGPAYLKYGDKLTLVSGMGSNATVNIEYIVQKH